MEILTIINSFVSFAILTIILIRYIKSKFYIELSKVSWTKRAYAITLWKIYFKNEYCNSSKCIFSLRFRNYKKLKEWDNARFKDGTYQQYNTSNETKK